MNTYKSIASYVPCTVSDSVCAPPPPRHSRHCMMGGEFGVAASLAGARASPLRHSQSVTQVTGRPTMGLRHASGA